MPCGIRLRRPEVDRRGGASRGAGRSISPSGLMPSGRWANMCSMIVAVHLPRLPLLVALLQARTPADAQVALGPAPGAPQVVGLCTPAAEAQGVRPGLRIGEALARCPRLELVVADPDAAAEAFERTLERLEAAGFAV